MSQRHVRPGSLTLFAILSFVIGGFCALGLLGGLMAIVMHDAAIAVGSKAYIVVKTLWLAASAGLLITGGVGLLRVSPMVGRWPLTIWAVLDVIFSVVTLMVVPEARESGMYTVVGLLFPVLLLLWLHVVCGDVWHPPRIDAVTAGDDRMVAVSATWISTVQALRQSLRAVGGPGFLLSWLFIAVMLLATVVFIAERSSKFASGIQQHDTAIEGMRSITTWLIAKVTGESASIFPTGSAGSLEEPTTHAQRWAKWLIIDHRPEQTLSWLLLSVLIPFVVTMATCGAIARDVGNRGFRFLLVRADRRSVFWGRFIAPVLVVCAANLAVALVGAIGFCVTNPTQISTTIAWSAWAGVALCITSLPYMALGLLCSTLVGHTFGSLAVSKGIIIGVVTLASSLAALWLPLGHVVHLLPVLPQLYLFHPTPWVVALAILACLAYTAVFLALARAHFLRRDL